MFGDDKAVHCRIIKYIVNMPFHQSMKFIALMIISHSGNKLYSHYYYFVMYDYHDWELDWCCSETMCGCCLGCHNNSGEIIHYYFVRIFVYNYGNIFWFWWKSFVEKNLKGHSIMMSNAKKSKDTWNWAKQLNNFNFLLSIIHNHPPKKITFFDNHNLKIFQTKPIIT